jgi:hypothetical protein
MAYIVTLSIRPGEDGFASHLRQTLQPLVNTLLQPFWDAVKHLNITESPPDDMTTQRFRMVKQLYFQIPQIVIDAFQLDPHLGRLGIWVFHEARWFQFQFASASMSHSSKSRKNKALADIDSSS